MRVCLSFHYNRAEFHWKFIYVEKNTWIKNKSIAVVLSYWRDC